MSRPSQQAIHAAAKKIHRADDPAIERHSAELFGTPTAKDPTPPEQRDAGPGRVLVEWIGESGPLAEARVNAAIDRNLLPATVKLAWEKYHSRITTRLPGLTHHTMSRERDGMSETITWGPWDYVQPVTIKDADRLLSGSFGYQFRIVGYEGDQPADMSFYDLYLKPAVERGLISQKTADQILSIVITEHEPEKLVGLEVQSDGRGGLVKTGKGAWNPTR